VLMQHYRAPTRLLDWSLSPWVATYFAASSALDHDGYVWCFNPDGLSRRAARPDVTALSEVTTLPEWQRAFLRIGVPDKLNIFRPSRSTPRMAAQQAVFTIGHQIRTDHRALLARSLSKNHRHVLVIRSKFKEAILHALDRMNLTAASLFPGLDGAGQSLTEALGAHGSHHVSPLDDWHA
jgi:FRG domain